MVSFCVRGSSVKKNNKNLIKDIFPHIISSIIGYVYASWLFLNFEIERLDFCAWIGFVKSNSK